MNKDYGYNKALRMFQRTQKMNNLPMLHMMMSVKASKETRYWPSKPRQEHS